MDELEQALIKHYGTIIVQYLPSIMLKLDLMMTAQCYAGNLGDKSNFGGSMSWWQSLCIGVAQTFFAGLMNAKPTVKAKAKIVALQIYQNIKIAFAGDPDFQ